MSLYIMLRVLATQVAILLVSLSCRSYCDSDTSIDSRTGVCPRVDRVDLFPVLHNQLCPIKEDGKIYPRYGNDQDTIDSDPKLLDFVFLVEHGFVFNRAKLGHVVDGLTTFLQKSQEVCYSDFQVQYAVVTYSLQHPSTSVLFQDFSPLHSQVQFPTDFLPQNLQTMPMPDPGVLEWQAVERTLQMVSTVASKGEISSEDGSTKRLHHRLRADLHIIVITDLQDIRITSAQASHKEKNIADIKSIDRNIQEQLTYLVNSLQFNDNIAFHFFVDSSSELSTTYLGHPSHSMRYKDCTHFNKALTLKALISAGEVQANSLQAHLLAKGIEAQVSDLLELDNHEDCAIAINPATWSSSGLHPNFQDRCHMIALHPCPKGFYCSPLHGCVRRKPSSKSDRRGGLSEGTFDNKVSLAPDFSLSHSDFIESGKESEEKSEVPFPPEVLSITAPPQLHAHPFSLTDVLAGSPNTLHWDPQRSFVEEVIQMGQPVLLKNTVVTTWPAIAKWNFTYLSDTLGDKTLEAVKHSNSFLTFDMDKRAPLKLNITLPFTVANMSTKMFFDCVQFPEQCSDGYKGHYYFSKLPDSLRTDVKPDTLLYNTEKDYLAQKQFMWISSAGMITHGHFDQDFNFFVQLIGEKRFTLWSSTQHDLMYVFPRVHPMWHKSRLNFRAPDVMRFPQFAKSRAVQVTVTPGDVLFIPPYTWHYVETLTPSVSLSTWSHDYSLYHHMNAIYQHDHKFDLLEDPRGW